MAVRGGAQWIATNGDKTLPTPRGPLPAVAGAAFWVKRAGQGIAVRVTATVHGEYQDLLATCLERIRHVDMPAQRVTEVLAYKTAVQPGAYRAVCSAHEQAHTPASPRRRQRESPAIIRFHENRDKREEQPVKQNHDPRVIENLGSRRRDPD